MLAGLVHGLCLSHPEHWAKSTTQFASRRGSTGVVACCSSCSRRETARRVPHPWPAQRLHALLRSDRGSVDVVRGSVLTISCEKPERHKCLSRDKSPRRKHPGTHRKQPGSMDRSRARRRIVLKNALLLPREA